MGWDPEKVKRLVVVRRMEISFIENRKERCLKMKVNMLVRGEEAPEFYDDLSFTSAVERRSSGKRGKRWKF